MKFIKQFGLGTLVALSICGSKLAFAGERGGNGGDAVSCRDGVVLLDYFEAKTLGKDIFIEGDGITAKLKNYTNRMIKLDPHRAKRWSERALDLLTEFEKAIEGKSKLVRMVDVSLSDVNDSNEIVFPSDCVKIQLVNQLLGEEIIEEKFFVHRPTWKLLDDEQKALTIMHEVIYEEALSMRRTSYQSVDMGGYDTGTISQSVLVHYDSRKVRYFNAIVASNQMKDYSLMEYIQILAKLKFDYNPSNNTSISSWTNPQALSFPINTSSMKALGMLNFTNSAFNITDGSYSGTVPPCWRDKVMKFENGSIFNKRFYCPYQMAMEPARQSRNYWQVIYTPNENKLVIKGSVKKLVVEGVTHRKTSEIVIKDFKIISFK